MEIKQIITIMVLMMSMLIGSMRAMEQEQSDTATSSSTKITVRNTKGESAQFDENIIDHFGTLRDMHADSGSNVLSIAHIPMDTFKQLVNDVMDNRSLRDVLDDIIMKYGRHAYSQNGLKSTIEYLNAAHFLQAPAVLLNRYAKIINLMIKNLPQTPAFIMQHAKNINDLIFSMNNLIRYSIAQIDIDNDPIKAIARYYAKILVLPESLRLLYNNNANFIALIDDIKSHEDLTNEISALIPQEILTSRKCIFYSGKGQPNSQWPNVSFSTDGQYLIITDYTGARTIIDVNTGQPASLPQRLRSTFGMLEIEPEPNPKPYLKEHYGDGTTIDKYFERFVDWGSSDHKMTLDIYIRIHADTLDQQLLFALLTGLRVDKQWIDTNPWAQLVMNTFSEPERAAIKGATDFKRQ